MIKTRLLIKVYGTRERAIHAAQIMVDNDLKELEAKAQISVADEGWLTLDISGEDEEFAANFLADKYGSPLKKVNRGDICKGYVSLIGDDRIVVDVGVPVTILQGSLGALGTGDARQIASRFGIIPHLPMEVEIDDPKLVTGHLAKKQLDMLWNWKKSGYDHVTANSVTRSELKAAIKKTGHARDIFGIERLGLMEHLITCRAGTDGPGIVAAIGRHVKGELGVIKAS
jgi:hypothetical protein